MTPEYKADKSVDWLDTWKSMEEVYAQHPDKVKAIGTSIPPMTIVTIVTITICRRFQLFY